MVVATPLWSSIESVRDVGGMSDKDSDSAAKVEKVFK